MLHPRNLRACIMHLPVSAHVVKHEGVSLTWHDTTKNTLTTMHTPLSSHQINFFHPRHLTAPPTSHTDTHTHPHHSFCLSLAYENDEVDISFNVPVANNEPYAVIEQYGFTDVGYLSALYGHNWTVGRIRVDGSTQPLPGTPPGPPAPGRPRVYFRPHANWTQAGLDSTIPNSDTPGSPSTMGEMPFGLVISTSLAGDFTTTSPDVEIRGVGFDGYGREAAYDPVFQFATDMAPVAVYVAGAANVKIVDCNFNDSYIGVCVMLALRVHTTPIEQLRARVCMFARASVEARHPKHRVAPFMTLTLFFLFANPHPHHSRFSGTLVGQSLCTTRS
jgi:hypothetical protein